MLIISALVLGSRTYSGNVEYHIYTKVKEILIHLVVNIREVGVFDKFILLFIISYFSVKALVKKSTNRVLLAQSWQDSIDLIFSLLTIPLGRVQFLLGSNICLGSVHNLYRTVSDLEKVKYMKPGETNTRLPEPEIPPYYLSCYQIFSLNQQISPALSLGMIYGTSSYKLFVSNSPIADAVKIIDPKGQGCFVKLRTQNVYGD